MDLVESTDFDFFDTPRKTNRESDDEHEKNITKSQDSKPKDNISNSDSKNQKSVNEKKRPSSLSGFSDDYSSDSVSSLSDSQTDNDQSGKLQTKKPQRTLSSDSSSSYQSQNSDSKKSPKTRTRKRSDSLSSQSDSKDSGSRSSASENSCPSGRRLKTRMGYRGTKKVTGKTNKAEEDSFSSSAYSDGEESTNGILGGNSDMNSRSQTQAKRSTRQEAWGVDNRQERNKDTGKSNGRKTNNERPKTAKRRTDRNRKRSKSPPPHQSDSEALSESDITDVSPMDSPRADDKSRANRSRTSSSHIGAAGDGSNVKAQFKALPLHEKDLENEDDFDESRGDSAGIDLNILMKAVGELEKKKRVEANSRRVMFAPMTLKRNEKANYTFTRDKTHDIDRENDRLLKEIVKQVHADRKKQYNRTPAVPKTKITPSAINREKEMRRIEADNLNFLKRLQKVKATSTISRTNQLKEYENTKLHGIAIATLHPMSRASSRASQLTDSFSSIGSRTRSLTSLHSVASTVRSTSSKRSSRPSSATKRIDHRPEWNDRW